jgi:hypothetical protein
VSASYSRPSSQEITKDRTERHAPVISTLASCSWSIFGPEAYILAEILRGFPHFLQENTGLVPSEIL